MRDVLQKSKNRLIAILLLSIIILCVNFNSYADEKQISNDQEQNKEIFIGRFEDYIFAQWCGNNALVVSGRKIGIEWIDILSKKTIKISSPVIVPPRELWQKGCSYGNDYPLNCTSDGRWVIYADRKSSRIDKGYKPPNDSDEPEDWDGGVIDLYRYDVTTGKTQRFAVVRALGPFEAVSPDGTKVFLGGKHNSSIEMPEPKWDVVYFKNYDWVQSGALWFLDSSGIVMGQNDPKSVEVEFFGKNGWAKRFELKQFEYEPFSLAVDKANRIYFDGVEKGKKKIALYRCSIKNKNLSCEKVLEQVGNYKVLPNGDIIITETKDCIKYITLGQGDGKCIAEKGDATLIGIRGISPDGKWLAFVREKKIPKGTFFEKESNLYILKLTNQ
ncbi:MAG: hypothetical protein AB1422_14360 [bacterium]